MSALAGLLNISDTEYPYVNTIGQQVVYDAVNLLLSEYNAEVALQTAIFIERETEKFAFRYLLPGGGKLQRMGRQAPAGAQKRYGYYDVGFPLRSWGAELAGDEIDMAYMTIQELSAHLDTIMIQDLNTMRWRILLSIIEDTNLSFTDPFRAGATTTVRRLANTDSGGPGATATLYPPVLGSETEANDNHYIGMNKAVSAIATGVAQNPVLVLRDEIAEHFGGIGSQGREFVYFHAADQTPYLQAMTAAPDLYTRLSNKWIDEGDNTATVRSWPKVPGRIHGHMNGCFLSEWDGWIPDKYGIMLLLGVGAPLIKRVDPAATGLPRGLTLVAKDENYPMTRASYVNRYGLGCGNRLSAAVICVNETAVYAPVAPYAE